MAGSTEDHQFPTPDYTVEIGEPLVIIRCPDGSTTQGYPPSPCPTEDLHPDPFPTTPTEPTPICTTTSTEDCIPLAVTGASGELILALGVAMLVMGTCLVWLNRRRS